MSLVSVVCCQVEADPSAKGVLPTVVCNCVWSKTLEHEAALARVELLRQKQTKLV